MSLGTVLRLLGAILVIGAVFAALNWFVDVDREDLERAIDRAGILGPATYAVILALGLTVPFNPVSDLATVTVAALVLDPWEAIAATAVAQGTAVTVNYYIARRYGRRLLRRVRGERARRLPEGLRRRMTLRAVFVLRFALPLTAIGIDVVGYLAGMQRLTFAGYFVASMVPWTSLSIVYFTSAGWLREISPGLVLLPAVVLLGATSLILLVLRRRVPAAGRAE